MRNEVPPCNVEPSMKRLGIVLALVLCGCSSHGNHFLHGDIPFRVIAEHQNPASCVQPPDFAVATTEDRWIDVFDRETECRREQNVDLPELDFGREVGLVAWWKTEGCLGFHIRTDSVERVGDEVVVRARASGPGPGTVCATARGALESFLVLQRSSLFTGNETVKFVLNGTTMGVQKAPY